MRIVAANGARNLRGGADESNRTLRASDRDDRLSYRPCRPDRSYLDHSGAASDRPLDQQRTDDPDLSDDDGSRLAVTGRDPCARRPVCGHPLHPEQAKWRQRTRRHVGVGRIARPAAAPTCAAFRSGVRDRGGNLYSSPALDLRRDREPDHFCSRRFYLEFRPARGLLRSGVGLRLSLPGADLRRRPARRIHAGPPRSDARIDLYRGSRKNSRERRRRLSPAVKGRPTCGRNPPAIRRW